MNEIDSTPRPRRGLPPGPEGIEFDDAVDEIMEVSFLVDRYDRDQVMLTSDAVQVLTFLIRWVLDENTGNAPNLYDRAKSDFEHWQRIVEAGGLP